MDSRVNKTRRNKDTSSLNDSSLEKNDAENTLQSQFNNPQFIHQRKLQALANNSPQVKQLKALQKIANPSTILQRAENNTGLPDHLKTGLENLSGHSMDDVKVHYNSSKPAQLKAHAFAQGNNIHLAPGQEKHLSHEAWHVVQQKQGRVKPTLQMAGQAINDQPSLEKEADEMGRKASQSGSNSELPKAKGSILTSNHSEIVQRKVGFEFETGWKVKKDGQYLEKMQKIGTGAHTGYKVEADDDGAMEFIIYPPLEVSPYMNADLNGIFDDLDQYTNSLIQARNAKLVDNPEYVAPGEEDAADQANQGAAEFMEGPEDEDDSSSSSDDWIEEEEPQFISGPFPLSDATGNQADRDFTVEPIPDGSMRANPQITAGMTLGQVAKLPAYLDEKNIDTQLRTDAIKAKPEEFAPRMNQTTYNAAGLDLEQLDGNVSDDLKGLVTLAATYIAGGGRALVSYPKIITDGFLLSRTDFVFLFNLLPLNEKRYFYKHPEVWINLVMRVANVDGSADDKVFSKGVIGEGGGIDDTFGPTRREWLKGILERRDLMSFAANEEYEGMGKLGDKVETVSERESDRLKFGGIFEIRAGQTQSLDRTQWRAFALSVADFFQMMQSDPSGAITSNERNKRLMEGKPID